MNQRNFGIDFLRILSMIMICIHHVIVHGVYRETIPNQYSILLLHSASICAVNCFAMTSGYVGIRAKYKLSNIFHLYAQVLFYCLFITACFSLFSSVPIGLKEWGNAFFPILRRQYWYFSAYVVVFLFIPLLNAALNYTPKRELKIALLIGIFLFSGSAIIPVFHFYGSSLFQSGYNGAWLCWLYLLGGFCSKYGVSELFSTPWTDIREYGRRFSLNFSLLSVICYCFCVFLCFMIPYLSKNITKLFLGKEYTVSFFSYTSLLVLFESFLLLYFCAHLSFRSWTQKLIIFFAPATFGVYLIHDHPLIRAHLMKYLNFHNIPETEIIFGIFGSAVAIFLICSCIDRLRGYFFKKFITIRKQPSLS